MNHNDDDPRIREHVAAVDPMRGVPVGAPEVSAAVLRAMADRNATRALQAAEAARTREVRALIAEAQRRWNHPNPWQRYRYRLGRRRLWRKVDQDLRRDTPR